MCVSHLRGRLNLDDKVGEGGFGSVWRCKGEGGSKLVRVDLERDVNALKGVLDGRGILELRHDHVVAYYDTFVHRAVKGSPLRQSTIADGTPWRI